MTNSTPSTDKKKKKPKKKGPIRFEAIIPVAILIVLMGVYFSIFFDRHMRLGLEFAGTHIHGAEVNIANISTSFIRGSFLLQGLQVTDKKKPELNLVQIEKIHFQFLWDALLRAKFVVDKSIIENIQAFSPRKRPGRVIPEDPKKESQLKKVEESVLNQAKEDFDNNMLGDVANILSGTDPEAQLKNIQAQLKSDGRAKELDKVLKEKRAEWDKRLKELPKDNEIKALIKRAESIRFDKDPLKALKEADKVYREADKIVKTYEKTNKDVNGDMDSFNSSLKELEQFARNDLKDLQKRFKIPDIDVGNFSAGLFGRLFQQKVATLKKYMAVGREYMPPKKSAEQKKPEIVPQKRGDGRNIRFPITTGYPLFWLKHAKISSEPSQAEYSGRLSGEIRDLTSDPIYLKKPTIVTLKGDFPKRKIMGLDSKLTIDHTTENPSEELTASIASYPVGKQKLSDSSDVKLIINKADGKGELKALLKNNKADVSINTWFTKYEYEVDAKSKIAKEILNGVMAGLPSIYVSSRALGDWSKLSWKIDSNLGKELGRGFRAQVDAKIKEAKAKLKAHIDGQLDEQKKKLMAELNKAKKQVTGEIEKKKKELEGAKQKMKDRTKSEKKKAEKKVKGKAVKEGKKALKKLLGF